MPVTTQIVNMNTEYGICRYNLEYLRILALEPKGLTHRPSTGLVLANNGMFIGGIRRITRVTLVAKFDTYSGQA